MNVLEVGILRESGNLFQILTELDAICIRLKFLGNLQLLCYGLLEGKQDSNRQGEKAKGIYLLGEGERY